jgi:hypothetical protein
MPIKCLYIDNEPKKVETLWQAVKNAAHGEIDFICQKPKEFGKQIKLIKTEKPDVLILELRLNENHNEKEETLPYSGFALAQELRTLTTEEKTPSLPIVLCSLNSKLQKSSYSDISRRNLFDRVYAKDIEIVSEPARVALELQSLVKGYQRITSEGGQFHKMLGLEKPDDVSLLHPHIGEPFVVNQNQFPVHEYATYILTELIETQGPLIDEPVLAARLGVDIQKSSDWERCKEFLSETCAYTGVFHEAWDRWWAFQLEEWWRSRSNYPAPLRRLKAKERVEFLRSTTGLTQLQAPASPIEIGYRERYWTICQGFKRPLDPIDGFRISCPNQKIWQELPYLSIKAALERGLEKGLRIAPFEHDRFNDIKERRLNGGA